MTNAQIIGAAAQALAEEGKIKYTGRVIKALNPEGKEVEIKETEAIHTFAAWKELGYQVQKGQKAVVALTIWKHTKAKQDSLKDKDGNELQFVDKGRMFMKTAHFFSASQVAKIENK